MVALRVSVVSFCLAVLILLLGPDSLMAQCPPFDLTCGAGIAVGPDGGTATARYVNSGPFTQSFALTNTGGQTLSVALSCSFSRGSCSVGGSSSVSIGRFQTVQRTVSFVTGPNGGSGVLTLTASGPGVSDQGRVTVPVIAPTVLVTAPAPVTVPTGATNRQAVFSVRNSGNRTEAWSFACVPVSPVVCQSVSPSAAQLQPGVAPTSVTVTYRVGSSVGSGGVTLRSRHAGAGLSVETTASVRAERYGVVVTADAPPVERVAGSTGHEHRFFVRNTGSVAAPYTWSCVPSSKVSCRGVVPGSATIASGQTVTVRVRYDVGSAGPGTVGLRASGSHASDTESVAFPVNAYAVAVSVVGGSATHPLGSGSRVRSFRIVNAGSVPTTFSLRCASNGAVECEQANLGSKTVSGSLGTATVGVPYRLRTTGTGWIELTASSSVGGGLSGAARLNVTVTAPPVSVAADSTVLAAKPTGTGPYAATFRITNGGIGSATFDLECFAAGGVSCEAHPPPVEIGGMGAIRTVSVRYTAGSVVSAGTVTLRASNQTNPGDSSSGRVTVPVERFGVRVTPEDSSVTRRVGQTRVERFDVVNTGSRPATFAVECIATAALECVQAPATVTLTPGQSTALPVTYRIGGASTGNALSLNVSHVDWREVGDVGRYWVSAASTAVRVSAARSVGVSPGSVRSHTVIVRNTGSAFSQFAVDATCQGPAFVGTCTVSSSLLGLRGGETDSVSIRFATASQLGLQGRIVARASPPSDPLAADSAIVLVAIGSARSLTVSTTSVTFPGRQDRSSCLAVSVGPLATSECGTLRVVHPLPSVRTMNRDRALMMLYNAEFAHPQPLVAANVGLPAGGLTPDSVRGRLIVDGVQRDARTWPGGAWGPGRAARIAMAFDALDLNTGVYGYQLEVVAYAGSTARSTAALGELVVVNRAESRYGAGWWLAGLEQLWFLPGSDDRMLWVAGDGSWAIYRPVAGSPGRWIAPSSTRPDTLRYDGAAKRYIRTLPGRLEVRFDAQGRHVETRNRLGHVTRFVYDGDPSNQHRERLSEIRVPTPSGGSLVAYRFEYGDGLTRDGNPDNDRLDRVSTLPGRPETRVTATIRTGGNQNGPRIQRIVDPDGRRVTYGYFGSPDHHVMRWREDGRGFRTTFDFGGAGRVMSAEREVGPGLDPVRVTLWPGEVNGLVDAVDTADAYAQVDGPRLDVDDVTLYWLDSFGAPRLIRDALGSEVSLVRSDPRFPAAVTAVRQPNGFVTQAFLGPRGNVDSTVAMREAGRAVTRYSWDGRFDAVRRIVQPEGEMKETDYNPATGNKRWAQDAGDPATRVHFRYNGDGQLRAVDPPLASADSLAYDALGNLRLTVSPTGLRRAIHRDALGRDTLVVTPIDTSQTAMTRRRLVYDLAGRVIREVTAADPVRFRHLPGAPTLPAESMTVWTEYDEEGNVRRLVRMSAPDPNRIDSVVTEWRYDGLGRVVVEVAPDGARDSTSYDAAGNISESRSRRGYVVTALYDVLNRVRERILPAIDYPDFTWRVPDADWRFPLFRTAGPLVPADTVRFVYDAVGNVVEADNRDARVSRRYHPDGTLAEDILRVRSFAGADWGLHVYRQSFGYDLNGRRIWHAHPSQLAPLVAGERRDTVYYGYDALGRADTVRTAFEGLTFTHGYDVAGRLRVVRFPGGIEERRDYDAEGSMRYRSVGDGTSWLARDSLRFDATGRVLAARGVGGRYDTRMGYTPLGALARSYETVNDWVGTGWTSQAEEQYSADALGNWRSSYRASITDPSASTEETTDYVYERGTGRLIELVKRAGIHWPNPSNDSVGLLVTTTEYDPAGNKRIETTLGPANAPAVLKRTEFYYGPDNRLRMVDKRSCYVEPALNGPPIGPVGCNTQTRLAFDDRWAFEEYRYDAFGRRVLTRSWENFCAGQGCARSVQRTVWDGHQVLYEIRYPGVSEQDGGVVDLGDSIPGPPSCSPECDEYEPQEIFPYGVMGYVHAAGVDEPLMAMRMFYGPRRNTPIAIVPHANWRGVYVGGTDGSGRAVGECAATSGSCVAVAWPGARQFAGFKPRAYGEDGPPAWIGSLLGGGRDASGQLYMRNRYYDPETGRFTQEDPIGLAGGLNLYGFAGGDPVNYRDPFGLCPPIESCKVASAVLGFGWKGFGLDINAAIANGGAHLLGGGASATYSLFADGSNDLTGSVKLDLVRFKGSILDVAGIGLRAGCSADTDIQGLCSAGGSLRVGAMQGECSLSAKGGRCGSKATELETSLRANSSGAVGATVRLGIVEIGGSIHLLDTMRAGLDRLSTWAGATERWLRQRGR